MDKEQTEVEERERVDKFVRQEGTTPVDAVKNISAMVVGVGAVGRPVAMMLAGMGVGTVQLVDPDRVEDRNIPTQLYGKEDVGEQKVDMTWCAMRDIDDQMEIGLEYGKFRQIRKSVDVVFCCVDSMLARDEIWKQMCKEDTMREKRGLAGHVGRLLIDGRMTAEVVRVLTMDGGGSAAEVLEYGKTLYTDEEAMPEQCTYRMSVYGAYVCAGLMVGQFSRWVRNEWVELPKDANKMILEKDTIVNLTTMDIARRGV